MSSDWSYEEPCLRPRCLLTSAQMVADGLLAKKSHSHFGRLRALLVCFLLLGCVGPARTAIDSIELGRDEALAGLGRVCTTAVFPGDHLVWDDLSNPGYRKEIGCDAENPCDEELANLHIHRMKERYFGARSLIHRRPGSSVDPLFFEMRVLREHNDVVREKCEAERTRIVEASADAIGEIQVKSFFLVLGAIGSAVAREYGPSGNQGCCSSHGGICGCGMGTVMCCDNTQSPTCRC